ncbi:MAG: sulfur carrier protein ThiS [Salibacteraceae bacterium]|mgnify:FL=1|nr:sulfur carrier protein ThiS [Salibacteraceae bacterium]|tara:strand:- start:12631 stop:12834 length:204 start_codon:yes stop_codon:yes gene_type:complete
MEVIVNNSATQVHNESSLSELISTLNLIEQKGIAIALNNKVVTKTKWESTTLSEKDKITIIKATQGG